MPFGAGYVRLRISRPKLKMIGQSPICSLALGWALLLAGCFSPNGKAPREVLLSRGFGEFLDEHYPLSVSFSWRLSSWLP
jgi:hypothetical protein